ncbi:UAA transporter family protein, partial [Teladorsagia circumcincta]
MKFVNFMIVVKCSANSKDGCGMEGHVRRTGIKTVSGNGKQSEESEGTPDSADTDTVYVNVRAMASPLAPILGVLGGCMGCMIFVEKIAKGYIPTVITFFTVNVINNQALNFHVPVPLHIIFRSGSLLANLLLSVILLKKKYTLRKYLSVFAITIGIVICTLATSDLEKNSGLSYEEAAKHYQEWIIGIAMLVFALLASAYLAICQQQMYERYGKHSEEAMFVIHAISLPLFSLMGADIMAAAMKFNE